MAAAMFHFLRVSKPVTHTDFKKNQVNSYSQQARDVVYMIHCEGSTLLKFV